MAQSGQEEPTWKDPIVEEIRAARQNLFAACEYDLDKLAKRLREDEAKHARAPVSYPKREPSKQAAL
jgi:hypothetical protein